MQFAEQIQQQVKQTQTQQEGRGTKHAELAHKDPQEGNEIERTTEIPLYTFANDPLPISWLIL